jgi:ethanolamine kinase
MGSTETQMAAPEFRYIPLSYSHADSQASALRLILTLNPDWEGPGNNIEFVRFTDGITNTVCLSIPVLLPTRPATRSAEPN